MPLKTSNDELPILNLTSMIDVLFLLIIFFVVGTKFVEEERHIDLKVPQVTTGALTAAPQKKVVNVYQDGQITLDQKPVTLDELTSASRPPEANIRAWACWCGATVPVSSNASHTYSAPARTLALPIWPSRSESPTPKPTMDAVANLPLPLATIFTPLVIRWTVWSRAGAVDHRAVAVDAHQWGQSQPLGEVHRPVAAGAFADGHLHHDGQHRDGRRRPWFARRQYHGRFARRRAE